MGICKVTHCDFVVWSESGFIAKRFEVDSEFFERKAEVV